MVARTLLFDCGNTVCKFRFGDSGGHLDSVQALPELLARLNPERVLVATVSALGQALCEALAAAGQPYSRIRVVSPWSGLALAYREPDHLGVDRWLTMVARCGRGRATILIDVGTALTIDAVDAEDRHLGGYILPGLGVMRRALVDDTFALPPVDRSGGITPGADTADCIANGSVLALAGAVDKAVGQYGLPDPEVIWTGGDARVVRPYTTVPGEHRPALVFEGMTRLMKDADYMEQLA